MPQNPTRQVHALLGVFSFYGLAADGVGVTDSDSIGVSEPTRVSVKVGVKVGVLVKVGVNVGVGVKVGVNVGVFVGVGVGVNVGGTSGSSLTVGILINLSEMGRCKSVATLSCKLTISE